LTRSAHEKPAPATPPTPAVPADLATIAAKAMAKNPDERYATAQDFADDLKRFLEDRPILARRPGLTQRMRKWSRRHRPLVVSLTLSAALLLAGGGLGMVAF